MENRENISLIGNKKTKEIQSASLVPFILSVAFMNTILSLEQLTLPIRIIALMMGLCVAMCFGILLKRASYRRGTLILIIVGSLFCALYLNVWFWLPALQSILVLLSELGYTFIDEA